VTINLAKLPRGVGVDAMMNVTFDNQNNPSESGIVDTKIIRQNPVRNYMVSVGPNDAAEFNKIHLSHFGSAYPLAMRDYTSYQFNNDILAWTAETDITVAPLRKLFSPSTGVRTLYERILVPDESEVPLIIHINGFSPVTGVSWIIQDPGIIVINTVLSFGDVVTVVSGQHLTPVCLTDDPAATVKLGKGPSGNPLFIYPDVRLRQILEAELIQKTS
jgi:hypothetical protein